MSNKKVVQGDPEYMFIKTFLSSVRDAVQRYKMAEGELDEIYKQEDDLRHAMENVEDLRKLPKLAKLYHEVRQKRRRAKNLMDVLSDLVVWYEDNQSMIKALERLQGALRTKEERVSKRVYANRSNILDDLK